MVTKFYQTVKVIKYSGKMMKCMFNANDLVNTI